MSRDLKDRRSVRGEMTKESILEAARESLRERGYSGTSTRAVAERAGVQLSLVHYHFASKRGVLVAVLERENEKLLERQHALFVSPGPLSAKWRAACAFLEDDLGSGYVRILWELWAAGLADDELAARWRDATAGWRRLLADVFEEWSHEVGLQLPVSATVVATLVANLFQGLETEILAGVSEGEAPHFEALEAVAELIERIEDGAGP
jgi:AcrR family transcriptional regulator